MPLPRLSLLRSIHERPPGMPPPRFPDRFTLTERKRSVNACLVNLLRKKDGL
jgi:hypothetical protein